MQHPQVVLTATLGSVETIQKLCFGQFDPAAYPTLSHYAALSTYLKLTSEYLLVVSDYHNAYVKYYNQPGMAEYADKIWLANISAAIKSMVAMIEYWYDVHHQTEAETYVWTPAAEPSLPESFYMHRNVNHIETAPIPINGAKRPPLSRAQIVQRLEDAKRYASEFKAVLGSCSSLPLCITLFLDKHDWKQSWDQISWQFPLEITQYWSNQTATVLAKLTMYWADIITETLAKPDVNNKIEHDIIEFILQLALSHRNRAVEMGFHLINAAQGVSIDLYTKLHALASLSWSNIHSKSNLLMLSKKIEATVWSMATKSAAYTSLLGAFALRATYIFQRAISMTPLEAIDYTTQPVNSLFMCHDSRPLNCLSNMLKEKYLRRIELATTVQQQWTTAYDEYNKHVGKL